MTNLDFFRHLGLMIHEGFLTREECAALRAEMRQNTPAPAWVFREGDDLVDEDVRKTKVVEIAGAKKNMLKHRLLHFQPEIEKHFRTPLSECEGPHFLMYHAGDFFVPHCDSTNYEKNADIYRTRRVSLVVFLNGHESTSPPEWYAGGALTFYGLIDEPRWKPCGFPMVGQPGLLVAFRSDVIHGVEPVTHGTRYTAVSWLH
jgi:predicted 2-oxoglutarate/Fe(II)-dependent dioxygenase YbiX